MIFAFFFSKISRLLGKEGSPVTPCAPGFSDLKTGLRGPGASQPRQNGAVDHPSVATLGPLADLPKVELHLRVQLCTFQIKTWLQPCWWPHSVTPGGQAAGGGLQRRLGAGPFRCSADVRRGPQHRGALFLFPSPRNSVSGSRPLLEPLLSSLEPLSNPIKKRNLFL